MESKVVLLFPIFSSLQFPSIKRGFRGVLLLLTFFSLQVPSVKIGSKAVLLLLVDVPHF